MNLKFRIHQDNKRIKFIKTVYKKKSLQFILFQMESKTPKLYDWEILESVAPYLNISDLIKTATLSKNYLRKHLLPKTSSSQGNQNQLTIAKKIFHRQLRIVDLSVTPFNQVSFVPNLILKNIQVGSAYTLLQAIQGKKYIVENVQLLNKQCKLKLFAQVQSKFDSKHLILVDDSLYTVHDSKLQRVAIKQHDQIILHQDGQIMFQTQIVHLKVSQTHIYLITQNSFHEQRLFAVNLKEFKSQQVLLEQQGKYFNQIDPEHLSVGVNIAYYVKNNKVYELDLENSKPPILQKNLKDKQIRRIVNGAKHFFAIEKSSKLTQQWQTKDVIQWAYKEKYQDYIKIFKSQKVTGKTLLTWDKRYIQDVLGILNVKIQQRMQVQLQQSNIQTQENCTIFAWGRNDRSQLGLNPSNNVSNPQKVTFPEGFTLLKCSNNTTMIYNKKLGKICINSVQNGKLQWIPICQKVSNIWSISAYKELLIVVCPVQKSHISQQLSQAPVHHKKQKLRTAKNIIDKIEWDQNIDKKQFRVGYLDKYTGILEITFEELLKSQEIKEYRIQYFKKNGEIVWSKKERIDIL